MGQNSLLPSLIRSGVSSSCPHSLKHIRLFHSALSPFYLNSGSANKNISPNYYNNMSETLDHLRRKPKAALSLISHLKECGFKHDLVTYMAVIRLFCYWGMIRRLKILFLDIINDKQNIQLPHLLEELLKEINNKKNSWVVISLDGLMKALISVKQFDQAYYDVLLKINRVPSVLTCNLFMNVLVGDGKLGMAMTVFRHLKNNGFVPNVYTYGIVVKGLCKMGYLKEAGYVIESMRKDGVEPNAFTFGSYVHGLCSNGYTRSASELLKSFKGVGSSVIDVFAYSCVVRGFVKEGRLQDAEDVFFEMKQAGVFADVYCYGALIEGYCRKRKIAKALDLHNEMCLKGIDSNCVIISSIMRCLCSLGHWSKVENQFDNANESGVVPDGISFNIAIDALCKLGRTGEARLLLHKMKKTKPPDVQHYTTLIHGFCLRKDPDVALEVFYEMIDEAGLEPDTVAFNALVGGLAKRGLVEKTTDLLNHMASRGLPPTNATYNIVIQGLCQAGKAKEARIFFDSLETRRVDNYVAMMNGCCETNNVHEAYRVFVKLSKEGKDGLLVARKPGSRCLKRLVRCLCEEGDTDKASTVFKTIISRSDDNDDGDDDGTMMMYSQLQSSYCKVGDIKMARRVFDTMIARGLRPDVVSYTIMLRGYLRANQLTEARRLLKDMRDRGLAPDLIFYTVLLDHRSKLDDPKVATLWHKIKDEGLKPDVIAYTVMLRCYLRGEQLTKADHLLKDLIVHGIKPDLMIYSVLLDYFSKSDHPEECVWVWKKMRDEEGVEPDGIAYASILRSYLRMERVTEVRRLLKEMIENDVEIDVVCCYMLRDHYSNSDDPKVGERLLKKMDEGGLKGGVVVYTIMLRFYLRMNWSQDVVEVLKDMMDNGMEVEVIWCTILVDHGQGSKKQKDGLRVLKKMKNEVFNPDVLAYESVLYNYFYLEKRGKLMED